MVKMYICVYLTWRMDTFEEFYIWLKEWIEHIRLPTEYLYKFIVPTEAKKNWRSWNAW
jgi:hypothetical protein